MVKDPIAPPAGSVEDIADRSARLHRAKRVSITRLVVLLLIVFGIFYAIAIPSYTPRPGFAR